MIDLINLKNFQSHEDSFLAFHPGVNVIVGTSDSGKSSIIRALKWLITNKPSGDAYKRHGQDGVSVAIGMNDGKTCITRTKNKKENSYLLNNVNYEGFGTNVPDEVSEALNFADINIQGQMDSPFLLSQSSGEISRYLNKLVGLDDIDKSLKNLASSKRSAESKKERLTSEVEALKKEIAEYNGLEYTEKLIEKAEKLESDIDLNKKDIDDIKSILSLIEAAKTDLNEFNFSEESISYINKAVELESKINAKRSLFNSLRDLRDRLIKGGDMIEASTIKLKELQEEFTQQMPDECPLCGVKGGTHESAC